jgi:hypothetical protein
MMKLRPSVICIFLLLAFSSPLFTVHLIAQTATGTLRGVVTDPSGAVVPQATVSLTTPRGQSVSTTTSNREGSYELKGIAPGSYNVNATAKGFAVFGREDVAIAAGQAQRLDIPLEIEVEQRNVTVEEEAPTVQVAPENNASSIIIKGKDLEALSDDPDELQAELQALAGPSAGPNGGQIYIDGFTGGQLPPKSSIREIRINQNPFSAQYDKLGYGRIEIFTKPGTNQFHGQFLFNDNNSIFNALNPFVPQSPPPPSYNTELFSGYFSGPLSKKASFFFNVERRNINDNSVVNAVVLDPSFNQVPFSQAFPNPKTRTNISPRLDWQLSQNNTLMIRYQFTQDNETNDGVGQLALPSQAYNVTNTEQTLQISDTQIISPNVINETRFQYIRDRNNQTSQNFSLTSPIPTLQVLGAFTDGPNSLGDVNDNADHYELQNYTSIVHGKHFIKFGGRLRVTRDANYATSNFNGTNTFSSLNDYQVTQCVMQAVPVGGCVQALQGLTSAQIKAAGPSQFSITTGQPVARITLVDAGLYAEDEWRLRQNMSLSYGLRFETQNQISDHYDPAPRVTFSWGLGRGKTPPKTVLRAGWGIFYDRFAYDEALQAERFNGNPGTGQVQTVQNFALGSTSQTIYQLAPDLRSPDTMQTGISLERQVTKRATVSLTYLNSRGEHQLFLRDLNAFACPGANGTLTSCSPAQGGVRPLANIYGNANVFAYDSSGIFRQNQLITNARVSMGSRLSLFGFYSLNFAKSDLGSAGYSPTSSAPGGGFMSGGALSSPGFLSDPYDPMVDYGRATFDVHQRAVLGGNITMPYGFRVNPFMLVTSGRPYNITLGQPDTNGDSLFLERPTFATGTASSGCTISHGFNTVPSSSCGATIIPINYGTGSAAFTLNLRVSKSFGFGPKLGGASAAGGPDGPGGPPHGGRGGAGAGGGGLGPRGLSGGGRGGGPFGAPPATRRYNLTITAAARNLFNHPNLASPVGNLNSPIYGQSNALLGPPFSSGSANRRIDLQALFSF